MFSTIKNLKPEDNQLTAFLLRSEKLGDKLLEHFVSC